MTAPAPAVDAAVNIFAKPYQTSLSLLSLLRFSRPRIGTLYLQFEPYGSEFDTALPYVIVDYLRSLPDSPPVVVHQPAHWLQLEPPDPSRMGDPEYRWGIRYQYAFEHSSADYLFTMHNDVLIYKDILGIMLEAAGPDIFAVGPIGQCWNCPARHAHLVKAAGCGSLPCRPERYADFQPDFAGLAALYQEAVKEGIFVRPYWEGWKTRYRKQAWPLPECRVNEWACLVNLALTRPNVCPQGPIPPYGAYEPCGTIALDIDVAWFRELNRLGLRAKHIDGKGLFTHWVGTGKMTRHKYMKAENNARAILEKQFPAFRTWCKKEKNGLFV